MKSRILSTVGVILLLLCVNHGFAQESRASLGGKVGDATGAAVPNATVSVKSVETGVVRTTTTNGAGEWIVSFLVPGHYSFSVVASSFRELDHTPVELQVSDQKLIDSRLEAGEVTATVSVESTTPLIDTTSAVSGTVIGGEQLLETPNESNIPTLLAALAPSVQVGGAQGQTVAHLWSNNSASSITANSAGASNTNVNYTLDGGNNTAANGTVAFVPPSDAVSEFRITVNAYDASIGRTSAATINLVTKSGTDHYHGDIFEFNQNNFLNANTSLNHKNPNAHNPVAPVHYNEFGVAAGGPIWIPFLFNGRAKHSYIFFSFDGINSTAASGTGGVTASLPTLAERNGDYSKSFVVVSGVRYPVNVYDPLTYDPVTHTRQQFPGNIIPTSRIDPVAKAIYALLPAPDNAGDGQSSDSNNFFKRETASDLFRSYMGRIDQNWNNNNVSYMNVRFNNLDEQAYNPFGNGNPLQGQALYRTNYGLTLDHAITLSPKLVADLRFNVARFESDSAADGAGVSPTTLGFNQSLAALSQLPSVPQFTGLASNVEISGLGTNQSGTYTYDTTYQFLASINQTVSRHNLHYGFEYLLRQEANGGLGPSSGTFGFGTNWTTQNPDAAAGNGEGSPNASFLLGLPTSGSIPTAATGFFSSPYYAVFLQDNWRASDRLTLNVGLRYDIEVPGYERFNRFFTHYDTNYVQSGITASSQPMYAALLGGSSTNLGINLLQQYRPNPASFVTKGGIEYAGVNGVSRSIENTRYKYLQPRVGFAYRFYPDTVLRGGLGRFVEGTFYAANYIGTTYQYGYSTSTPFIPSNDNFHTVAGTLDNPFPNGKIPITGNSLGELTNPGFAGIFPDPNYGRPYTDETSLYLDQQVKDYLFEIGGTLNITHGRPIGGVAINDPGQPAWLAAFGPQFDSTGRPVDTLPGNVQVANPFKGAPNIVSGVQNQTTIDAYDLLRPSPLNGNLLMDRALGKRIYYAMNTKVEKRFNHGFSLLNAFTWSKTIQEDSTIGPQDYAFKIERRLSSGDERFLDSLNPIYTLPFGRKQRFGAHFNRAVDEAIGGWQVTGLYQFASGTPVALPTNSSFFRGGDPALSPGSQSGRFIDPNAFVAYPSKNTSYANVHNSSIYPTWTGIQGLPGYNYAPSATDSAKNGVYNDFTTRVTYNQTTFGDIRQPYTTTLALGVRKNFAIAESTRVELRFDAFNALNHPTYGGIGTSVGSAYFGQVGGTSFQNVNQSNQPRAIQISGRVFF